MVKPLLAVCLAGLALWGCETSPQPAPETKTGPAATTPSPSDPHEIQAPMVLSIEVVREEGNVLELNAHLDARAGLAAPVELTVALPEGTRLVQGESRQSVPVPQGRTTRFFRFERSGNAPVKVIAHAAPPGGAWGLHAEKSYPAAAEVAPVIKSPTPPAARPPVAPVRPVGIHGGK